MRQRIETHTPAQKKKCQMPRVLRLLYKSMVMQIIIIVSKGIFIFFPFLRVKIYPLK